MSYGVENVYTPVNGRRKGEFITKRVNGCLVMASFSLGIGLMTVFVGSVLWLLGVINNQVVIYGALIALLTSIAVVEFKLYKLERRNNSKN